MMTPAPSKALIQEVAALRQKKCREETGRILVEARHPIEEAVRAGLLLREVFYLKGALPDALPQCAMPKAAIDVDEQIMARMASTSSPPPCLAVFDRPQAATAIQGDLALVLDGLQDPGNLGTLVRSAVAFGFGTVILTGEAVEAYNPKVIRSSAGLVFAVAVLQRPRSELASLLEGWRVFTTTGQAGAMPYRDADYAGPCAVILGSEGQGVSPELKGIATAITIPMDPLVESLNVAVSGSVIMAEAAAFREQARVGAGPASVQ